MALGLKISSVEYQGKITELSGLITRLDSKITQYETLKNNMDKFIEGGDGNYEKLRMNVENNIAAVRKAREMTEAAMNVLQQQLEQAEDFSHAAGQTIDNLGELASNAFKGAIEVMKLID